MVHFLIDESFNTGKEPDPVISMYLLWKVITGLNASISISFLPVRHKIFSRLVLWPFKANIP
uniref:Uncharacterized protein n=1 Tax=Amphimedon queenslandica TaxID=400682 RepID=A0A1X7TT13_AMPQE